MRKVWFTAAAIAAFTAGALYAVYRLTEPDPSAPAAVAGDARPPPPSAPPSGSPSGPSLPARDPAERPPVAGPAREAGEPAAPPAPVVDREQRQRMIDEAREQRARQKAAQGARRIRTPDDPPPEAPAPP